MAILGAVLGEGGAALGSAMGDALAGEAGAAAGANIGRAAGQDIGGKLSEMRQRKKQNCQQAFPDDPELCYSDGKAFR